jgi:hypothetical protein
MRLGEAKTYKDYYVVVEIIGNGVCRSLVTNHGSTKLGYMDQNEILVFEKKKDAKEWIEKHSYTGMSFKYEIGKITNLKETNWRWEVVA